MVTFTDRDDRRSAHLRNRAIQNANAGTGTSCHCGEPRVG